MTLNPDTALRKDILDSGATLQHRHFAAIAAIIRMYPAGRQELSEHFAGELRYTNPRFDRDRFLRACGASVAQKVLP